MRKKLTFLLIAILASLGAMAQDVVEISTVEQLKAFRDAVNSGTNYKNRTVKLTADIDLSSESNWVPIGNLVAYPGQSFNGVFDGGGHSISNLTCTDNTPQYAVAGLFGSIVSGTIKDLTVKNVDIKSTHYAGGIVAYTSNTPTIENCHVIGGTISSTPEIVDGSYDNGDKVGGIMGYATAGSTINNCTVQDVTITAYRDMGGIIGYSDGNVTNNTVIDVTVTQDLTNGYKDPAPTTIGDIIGRGSAVSSWESNNNKVLKSVAQYAGKKYVSLQDALDAAEAVDDPNIVIDLLADVTYEITAWSGDKNPQAFGTKNTQSITINGNNHTLDFFHKNSDWNNVATNNDPQTKLILNNMALTNSGHNDGPWNRHDINFNCAVELNDVTSDKALAFKNSVTLNNVTVTETGAVYCVWIQANGQTVDINGLNVTAPNGGRGIKVDDQYVADPQRVTLNIANSTFTTAKKAAILVDSKGGVDVNNNGGNNIDNVAADNVNLVWVDPGSAANYTLFNVNNATKTPESKESDYVARLSDAEGNVLGYYGSQEDIDDNIITIQEALENCMNAVDTGYTVTIFKAGSYTMPGLPKNITVEAAENVDGVVFNHTGSGNIASVPNGATFKNLTFNFGNNDYHGFQHAGTINMEGCTLNGKLFSYGAMNFTKCVFNQSAEIAPKGDYNMWTYGVNDVKYTECTFKNTKTGKFLNVYREGDGYSKVYVDKCKFINEGSVSKAALNVKATCGSTLLTYDVYITESTIEGAFPAASISSPLVVLNELVQVDDRTATGVDNIRVWKDDVQIYPLKPVAKIGEVGYPTLQSAVDAAYKMTGDVTIQLVDDITEYAIVLQKAGLNLTIDGKDGDTNHTIKGQIIIDGAGNLDNTETLVISNLNFEGNKDDFSGNSDAFILIPSPKDSGKPWHYTNTTNKDHYNYAHNITVSNCSFVSTSENSKGYDVVGVKVPSQGARNIVIDKCSGDNLHSLAQLAATEGGAITNCEVKNGESLVNVNGGSGTFTVSGNTLAAAEGSDGYGVRENGESSATINLSDNNFKAANAIVFGKGNSTTAGTINVTSGTYVGGITKTTAATGKIVISGGHFSAPIYEDAYSAFIAEGLTGINGLYANKTPEAPNGVAAGIVKVTETDGTISFYPSLQEAVDAAGENAVVTPLIDIDLAASSVVITKPLTIDGENHAISSTAAQAILLKSTTEGNVKIQNVNITASKGHGIQIGDDNTANIAKLELEKVILTTAKRGVRVYKEGTGFGIAIANSTIQSTKADPKTTYTTGNEAIALSLGATDGKGYEVTIENTVLQGYSYLINNVTSGSNINVTMTGGATYGRAAVNVWGKNNTFTLDGVEVHGLNNQTGPTEAFSCIVENIGAENNEFTIKDSKFIATLSEAAATTEGSSATEQMIDFRGSGSTAKILGETTYECNYPERGGLIYNEGALENNKMYFDDTTKATFANAFTEAVISDEKEQPINLYPVNFTSEIYYYWFANGVEAGENCNLIQPYAEGWLSDGEFIRVKKDITLKSNIETKLASGTSYTLTFGEYNISKGDYSITMKEGVTVYTDKQTDIFSSATEGCDVYELTTETGYAYVCGNYVAKVNNKLYNSFADAVTAAAGTKVILLLKDIADTYAMSQGETLKVQKDGKAFNDPTAPADFTLKTVIDGAVTIYSVKANENLASISEGYYHIKNLGNGKYVNVKGRRTATVDATADDASTAAGTIIKVKANANGQVEVLRSQAIDIPHYADRAMSYVHDFAKILVEKLNASGSGEILGTTGYEAIMKKFDDNFDHHLYVEEAQGGYRIFGRTPSMKPVVEFYQENKDKVDAKLPMLEQKINDAIAKVVDKVGKGSSLIGSFKLHTIWQRMNNSALTEPNDDATKLAFLQEVLSSEINVWNFAYESATFYMEKVEGSQYFEQIPAEIRNYWNLAKQVHPDFKYYIVQKDGKMDFISEGNTDIIHNNPRTVWALEGVDKMTVSVPEENSRVVGATFDEAGKRTGFETAYYTTLYTDFGYQLPKGVTALKVTKIKDTYLVKQKPENKITYESDGVTLGLGLLETKEIGQDVPAQTPVLIMSKSAEPFQITIGDIYGASADVTDNLLHGADWLINEYKINTPALENLFALVEGKVSESITDKYEHLLRRNSGTVNNKYFFPISVKEDLAPAYKNKTGYKMQISPVLVLGKKEGKKLAFNETKDVIQANSVFLFSEENKPALFTLTGDVTRDGIIDVEDVTGQVNIVQKRDKKDYNYDYDAADVVVGETYYVDVDDVTRVLNIIQKRTDHPDLP